MDRSFHKNAARLRNLLGTDSRPVIDCTGAKQLLLQKLAQMRAAMAEQDPRYADPNYSPYSEEESKRVMANLKEWLSARSAELEERWGVRFVSRGTDD